MDEIMDVMPAENVLGEIIGRQQVLEATQTLQKYKQGKANLEARVIANEQWWKLQNDEDARQRLRPGDVQETKSAWLWNVISAHHATSMDNYPAPNILPHEESDQQEAATLSSIVPVVLAQNNFEDTYSDVEWRRAIAGTGFYKVMWDAKKLNGLGDISVVQTDILNLFWEPGIVDLQASHNMFHVELMANEDIESQFPQAKGKLSTPTVTVSEYVWDDTIDTTGKSAVVDWYYKRSVNGKTVLHYCRYVNDVVLYSSENEGLEDGYYEHGKYPFVAAALYPIEGTLAGYGYIDIGKGTQTEIDMINNAVVQNTMYNATPRYFVRQDGQVNEDEYREWKKHFIHVGGNLGADAIRPVDTNDVNGNYIEFLNMKIQELKEVSGNRDVSNGSTSGGATAASAIAALQEAGAKLDRDVNKGSYRAFREVVYMVIELIRQFYDQPRQFRITGENGEMEFATYSNANIRPQQQLILGQDYGYRTPEFDIEVTAQKSSPYQKQTQNELMLQFYQLGFFNPELADQALAALKGMDFDRKQEIVKIVTQNKTMADQIAQLQQVILQLTGAIDPSGQLAQQYAAVLGGQTQSAPNLWIDVQTNQEHANVRNARERVAEQSDPNSGGAQV
uniref:Portal protein n=1 Tax=Myoviridae sp. ctagO6 TaxID=2826667 RepID=A0A8S5NNJ5_9CAUD|nr:MAG TPA: Portal protein [Myoviridae sp. ctagO6]